jgi:DNA-binding PadR family transcriptional regulator
MTLLGSFEELALLAIAHLGEEAYGLQIRELIEQAQQRPVSLSAVYTTLERMERKKYLTYEVVPGGEDRGGKPKRRYELTMAGRNALGDASLARKRVAEAAPSGGVPQRS